MTKKTYHGSCHCGAVRYEAELDLAEGTGRCNCSICAKLRSWGARAKPEEFRLLAGEDALAMYQFGTRSVEHPFCRHCGVHVFYRADVPQAGGKFIGVNLASLDDVEPQELIAAPVRWYDGRANNWMNPPAETRHL